MVANQVAKVYLARVLGDFRKACSLKKSDEEKQPDVYEAACNHSVYCISNIEAKWDCSPPKELPFEYKH